MSGPIIGLALGGGGARGAAHVGALQVLHNNQIPIHQIAGTSIGSVVGAMYAATLDPQWIENRFKEFIDSEEFRALGIKHLIDRPSSSSSAFNQIVKKVKDQIVIFKPNMGVSNVSLGQVQK